MLPWPVHTIHSPRVPARRQRSPRDLLLRKSWGSMYACANRATTQPSYARKSALIGSCLSDRKTECRSLVSITNYTRKPAPIGDAEAA